MTPAGAAGAQTPLLSSHGRYFGPVAAAARRRARAIFGAGDKRPRIWQPALLFGFIVVALIWLATLTLISQARQSAHHEKTGDATNLAVLLDREVAHTIHDLDRILLFVRSTHERLPGATWQSIISEKFAIDSQVVQIAVIDAKGMMVTSTTMPVPAKPIDLSDREHFRVQRDATEDRLFISKPVLGRASGKLTVQFARRLADAQGRFDGVLVISLDTAMLTRAYAAVDFGAGYGMALLGDDGIVRSGLGRFGKSIGETFPGSADLKEFFGQDQGATVAIDRDDLVEALRSVDGYPLNVAVALPGVADDLLFASSVRNYRIAGVVATLVVVLTAASAALRRYWHEKRLLHMARHDPLTGLPNRARVHEGLSVVFASPPEQRNYALHIVDLDGFKLVNDTYGHLIGDELLRVVATRMAPLAGGAGEFVARLGGDEFAILHRVEEYEAEATALGQRVVARLSEPYQIGNIELTIGASIGFASAKTDAANGSGLLQAADLALYAVKSNGRASVRRYDSGMLEEMRRRMEIEAGLRLAIENQEFELFYQPLVDTFTKKTVGLEALIRWCHPQRGLVFPGEFISVAEETGMIVPIGEWVLRRACQDVARLEGALRLAVNLSPRQFAGHGVAQLVRDALRDSGLPPQQLEIEITESMLIQESHSVLSQLSALRALGCHIAMDDFGTGYSSLSYLSRYPIDKIKIDRAFTSGLGESRQAWAVVKAIVDLAEAFEIRTLAEGVETEGQLQVLRDIGCFEAQGYLFSKPKPLGDFVGAAARAA